jgi:hypothetical protein
MPRVGFEITIPASKQAKTVHALDHSATVTGQDVYHAAYKLEPGHQAANIYEL